MRYTNAMPLFVKLEHLDVKCVKIYRRPISIAYYNDKYVLLASLPMVDIILTKYQT